MNLKSFLASLSRNESDRGTTFVEVLVAMTILAIVSIAIWSGFAASVSLSKDIPTTVNETADLFLMEGTLQKQVARVRVPLWVYKYEPEDDSTTISLPYCDSLSYKVITFEYTNNNIEITTASTNEKIPIEPEEPKITIGPFE
jgi:prepilin-type N-terminal cleavage/methylation domain-containing protein